MANLNLSGTPEPPAPPEKISLKEMEDKLERISAKTEPGASNLMPKERLFDATDVQAKMPDYHIRWLNIQNPEKVATRQLVDGYERISNEEGGRQLGATYALFRQPRAKYDEREKRNARHTRELERAHETEFEGVMEGVARYLRDRMGLKVNVDDIILRGG